MERVVLVMFVGGIYVAQCMDAIVLSEYFKSMLNGVRLH